MLTNDHFSSCPLGKGRDRMWQDVMGCEILPEMPKIALWSSQWFEEISVSLIWLDLIWLALIWLALIWLALIWLALIWLALIWLALIWDAFSVICTGHQSNTTGSLFQKYVYSSFSMKMVLNCIHFWSADLFLVKDNAPARNLIKSIFQECSNLCSIFHLSGNVDTNQMTSLEVFFYQNSCFFHLTWELI